MRRGAFKAGGAVKQILTAKEVKDKLSRLTIVVDTREAERKPILDYFDSKGIQTVRRKLDVGDYSAEIDGVSFEDEISVEVKMSIDEIAGNFTVERERFEREFLRAKANNVKMFLLIEDASWEKIACHSYRSKMEPKALMASLLAFQVRYGITVMMCQPEMSGQLIHATLFYHAKERLERG